EFLWAAPPKLPWPGLGALAWLVPMAHGARAEALAPESTTVPPLAPVAFGAATAAATPAPDPWEARSALRAPATPSPTVAAALSGFSWFGRGAKKPASAPKPAKAESG